MGAHSTSHVYKPIEPRAETPRDSRDDSIIELDIHVKKKRNTLAWLCAFSWTITFLTVAFQLWNVKISGNFSYASGWATEFGEHVTSA
jgi:hypothetical protein